jgi:predicted metal-dependent peptidase
VTATTIDPRIIKARSALLMLHAFFGSLAMRLRVAERNDIQTMATDGKYLFYRRAFLDTVTERDVVRIVAHEVLHCALSHHTRRNGREHELWNIACDHIVNLMLKKAGFVIPPDRYCDDRFDRLNAEEVYRILDAERKKQEPPQPQPEPPQPQQDQDGEQQDGGDGDDSDESDDEGDVDSDDGDGDTDDEGESEGEGDAGGADAEGEGGGQGEGEGEADAAGTGTASDNYPTAHGDPGGDGEVLDAAPEHDKAANDESAEEWQVFARQAANIARRKGEGKLPGFAEEIIETLNDPRTDWRDVLRRFVDPSATKDYAWTQPNRRLMSMGYYAPGLITDGVHHVALLVDTSGSIDHEWLRKFGGEAQAALDDGAIDKVTVVFADTRVTRAAEFVRGEQIDFTVQGRGGTEFAPTFAWLNENAPDITAAVYFTDLDCSSFGPEPSYPVLWAAYDDSDPRALQHRMARVPFGECIELKD